MNYTKPVSAIVLVVWFMLVLALGANGAFTRQPGEPPLPILFGAVTPLIVFFAAFGLSRPFRDAALAMDPRFAAGIQAWRFAGLGFIALHTYAVLPGMFAWPAGLGDIAIGMTAPWMIVWLIRRPNFAASRLFVIWNLLGLLDLVVAVGTGVIGSMTVRAGSNITTAPMSSLPLVLIPAYFVPIFIMLHVIALVQARRLARSEHTSALPR